MKALKEHEGIVAVLGLANIDTDQIIPKQFLKSILRTGFGESLFFDWRYLENGDDNPEFELNRPEFKGASVLIAGNNFGCGSSREHAVWAVEQYGLRVLIAPRRGEGTDAVPGFADIFRNNCSKNGILTIELSESEVQQLSDAVLSSPGIKARADVEAQTIELLSDNSNLKFSFEIDSGTKNRLLNGLDDIGLTLSREESISGFETSHQTYL